MEKNLQLETEEFNYLVRLLKNKHNELEMFCELNARPNEDDLAQANAKMSIIRGIFKKLLPELPEVKLDDTK